MTWVQQHERLIIIFLVLSLGCYLGNKYLNNSAAEASAKYTLAQRDSDSARLQASQTANQYQVTLDAMIKANDALVTNLASRQTVLVKTQATIETEKLPELATEWQRLIGGSGTILPRTDGISGLSATDDAARTTVSQLEAVPVLEADVKDLQIVVTNTQAEVDKGTGLISSLTKEISANDVTCKAQVVSLKADSRKTARRWFVIGFIAGLGTRVLGKF